MRAYSSPHPTVRPASMTPGQFATVVRGVVVVNQGRNAAAVNRRPPTTTSAPLRPSPHSVLPGARVSRTPRVVSARVASYPCGTNARRYGIAASWCAPGFFPGRKAATTTSASFRRPKRCRRRPLRPTHALISACWSATLPRLPAGQRRPPAPVGYRPPAFRQRRSPPRRPAPAAGLPKSDGRRRMCWWACAKAKFWAH